MKNMSSMSNTSHSMTEPKEIMIMIIIMFISGLLSSMNIWVDKISDIYFHLNDVYMALLMCGWSLIIMGIYYIHGTLFTIGIIMTSIIIYCIRNQLFIDEKQYLKGMIPHHSMAVLMSKQLLDKSYNDNNMHIPKQVQKLVNHITNSQEYEINLMKSRVNYIEKIKNS